MDSLWGEDDANKTEAFNKAVEDIENKHSDLFADKINVITGRPPDKLLHQFLTTYDGVQRTCGFRNDTYVPEHIQEEVYTVFKEIFSSK